MWNECVVQAPVWPGIASRIPKFSRGYGRQLSAESSMQLLLGKNSVVQVTPRPEAAAPSRQMKSFNKTAKGWHFSNTALTSPVAQMF